MKPEFSFRKSQDGFWQLIYNDTKIYQQWWNQTPEEFLIEVAEEHLRRL